MFWALVAPELVLAWSAKQWYVAGKIAKTYNRSKKGEIKRILSASYTILRNVKI